MPIVSAKKGILPPSNRLKALRSATVAHLEDYSRFVRLMKRALPAAAAGLALVVVALAMQPHTTTRQVTFTNDGETRNGDDLTMFHPRLTGTDDSGSPFLVTADTATQEGPSALKVRLHIVNAQLTMKDGLWVRLASQHGFINSEQHLLDINDQVTLTADGGYEAHSSSAHFDLTTGIVNGHSAVYGRGPYGTFAAHGFEIHKEERQLVLTGGVAMLLHAATEPHK